MHIYKNAYNLSKASLNQATELLNMFASDNKDELRDSIERTYSWGLIYILTDIINYGGTFHKTS